MKRFAALFIVPFLGLQFLGINSALGDIDTMADFIINLANEVSWPEGSFNKNNEFVISVIGNSDLAARLEKKDKSKSKYRFIIKNVGVDDDIENSHLVFLGITDLPELAKILKRLKTLPILTVTNSSGFARYGVMIELLNKDDKVEYAINKMTARDARIEISDKLIKKAIKTFG